MKILNKLVDLFLWMLLLSLFGTVIWLAYSSEL